MIIGLAGRAGAGKNAVADILCELMPGTRQIAFAEPLRRIAADVYDISPHQFADRELKEQTIPEWGLSPRQILQRLGTEVGRQIHPETWTRYAERQITKYPFHDWVVTDVRMPNEAEMIIRHGGEIWWVDRSPRRAVSQHETESALDWDSECIDRVVHNHGTLLDLRQAVAVELDDALEYACTAG